MLFFEETRIAIPDLKRVSSIERKLKGERKEIFQEVFDVLASEQTVIELDVTSEFNGSNVKVQADINSFANIPSGLTAHIVVIENKTVDNTGSNGETEFFNVMMQMLPSSQGTQLIDVKVG